MSFSNNNIAPKAYLAEGGAIGAALAVIPGTAANQVKLPTAADTEMPVGITYEAVTAAGKTIEVFEEGVCNLVVNAAGTAIAVGDPITIHGVTGRGKKSTLANTHKVFAVAREAATADGVTISVRIDRSYMPAA